MINAKQQNVLSLGRAIEACRAGDLGPDVINRIADALEIMASHQTGGRPMACEPYSSGTGRALIERRAGRMAASKDPADHVTAIKLRLELLGK